jgi:hypothetical protein
VTVSGERRSPWTQLASLPPTPSTGGTNK